MLKLILLLFIITISGCTTVEEEKFYTKNQMGYNINCSGALDSWAFCHKEARNYCPSGYEKISSNESKKDYSLLTLDPGLWVGSAEINPRLNREMYIICK